MANRKSTGVPMSFILLFVGAILIAIGVFTLSQAIGFRKYGVKNDAVISEIYYDYSDDSDNVVWVTYTVNGIEYTARLNAYSMNMREGDTVPIYYFDEDPTKIAYAKGDIIAPVIIFALGGFILSLITVPFVFNSVSGRKLPRLKNKGSERKAKINDVEYKQKFLFFNDRLVYLTCSDQTGIYTRKFFASVNTDYTVGDTITVYVNYNDPDDYAVDVKEYARIKAESSHA